MSYSTIEARVQTLLQAMAEFADADVTRGDFTVLDSGSPPYAVLWNGGFRASRGRTAGSQTTANLVHRIEVRLYDDYLTGSDYTDMQTLEQAVIEQLLSYPTLNGLSGVTSVFVEEAAGYTLLGDAEGGFPVLIRAIPMLVVTEHVTVAHQE